MNSSARLVFDRALLHPRYWISWLAVGLLRLIAALPFRAKLVAGSAFGRISYYLISRRRHIVQTNVANCFPDLSAEEQEQLAKDIFRQNGIGFFEIAWAWWASPASLEGRFEVEGLEVLQAAQADGKGVLLIGAHFTHLDLVGLMINRVADMDVIYRRNNNPVFEYVITKGRLRVFKNVLERSDMRLIVRKLREGRVVWYSPDQDHGIKHSVFAPFFGIPAATVTAGSRLMKLGQANAVFLFHYRDPETQKYRIIFHPAPAGFPSGDDVQDATLMNQVLETGIRMHPDQYMWVHRRFKTRPESEASFY